MTLLQTKEALQKLQAAEVQHWADLLQSEQQATEVLRKQVLELQSLSHEKETALVALHADAATSLAHIERLTEQCTAKEQQVRDLEEIKAGLSSQAEKLMVEKDGLRQQLTNALSIAASMMTQLKHVSEQASRTSGICQSAATQLSTVEAVAAEQSSRLAQLEEALDAATVDKQMADEELGHSQALVKSLQQDVLSLRAKSALLQSSLGAERSRAEAATASMQASLQATLSELETCRLLSRDRQVSHHSDGDHDVPSWLIDQVHSTGDYTHTKYPFMHACIEKEPVSAPRR